MGTIVEVVEEVHEFVWLYLYINVERRSGLKISLAMRCRSAGVTSS